MRRGALAAVLLLAASCGAGPDAVPDGDLSLEVRASTSTPAFGEGFDLEVVRTWQRDLVPDPFRESLLLPLRVRSTGVATVDFDDHVRETLHFRAYCFSREPVVVQGLRMEAVPRGGGTAREAVAPDLVVDVHPALDGASPGVPEGLLEPLGAPRPLAAWMSALGMVVAAAMLLLGRSAGSASGDGGAEEVHEDGHREAGHREDGFEVAMAERLEALRLRAATASDGDAVHDFHVDAARAARDILTHRGLVTATRTSEELLDLVEASGCLGPTGRTSLGGVLLPCDLVKFAAARPEEARRTAVVDRLAEVIAADGETRR